MSCPRTQLNIPGPGLKPGPLALESSAVAMRPPCLPQLDASAQVSVLTCEIYLDQSARDAAAVKKSIKQCNQRILAVTPLKSLFSVKIGI